MKTWQEWKEIVEADQSDGNGHHFGPLETLGAIVMRSLAGYRQNANIYTRKSDEEILNRVFRMVEQHARELEREAIKTKEAA